MLNAQAKLQLTTLSPLSHFGDERAGNVAFARRLQVSTPGGVARVPIITGNSFRGKLRRIAARRMCEIIGVTQMEKRLYHFLFSGGTIEKGETKVSHDIAGLREMRNDIPFIGLFGGAWQTEILPGSLMVGLIWPACRETSAITGVDSELTCNQIIEQVMYTRRDDYVASGYAKGPSDSEDNETSQMIYEGEAIIPGVGLAGILQVRNAAPNEFGCLVDALAVWSQRPSLGGMTSKGHGQVRLESRVIFSNGDGEIVADDFAKSYSDHLGENKDTIAARLSEMGAEIA